MGEVNKAKRLGVTPRALIVALLLMVPNSYFVVGAEVLWEQGLPTRIALFYSVVFIMFIVTLLNVPLEKFLPKAALTRAELLFIYIMLSLGASLTSTDMLQGLMVTMGHPFWFATPENDWKNLFGQYIPKWLAIEDMHVLKGFYRGDSTLYIAKHIKVWMSRALIWSSFTIVLVFTLLCINVILRKQWVEREKLTYPIIQLPLEMTRGYSFFKNKLLWLGFILAGGIDVLNGLSHLYPIIPSVPVKSLNIAPFFTEKPWNAIGWTLISFYPFLIGFSYLVPLDLCFSIWFFFVFWKAERIIGSVAGLEHLPQFPYVTEQSFGAYMGLCIFAIWTARKYVSSVLKKAFFRMSPLDDSKEPMRYRWALLGLASGMIFLVLFSYIAGMSLWVAITFFAIYFMVSITIVRMRAEVGPPEHSFDSTAPGIAMISMFGSRYLGKRNLVMFSFYFWFTRTYRGHPAPHQLEGFKIANVTGIDVKKLLLFMMLFMVFATFIAMWMLLHFSYNRGATSQIHGWYTGFSRYTFSLLDRWVNHPMSTDRTAVGFMGIGLIFTLFLQIMRMRFFFMPFHAVGYALAGSLYMNWVWFPFLLGWLIKGSILKFGGLRAYRQMLPFFLGLILGEYIVGSIWNIIGIAVDYPMYKFWR